MPGNRNAREVELDEDDPQADGSVIRELDASMISPNLAAPVDATVAANVQPEPAPREDEPDTETDPY